MEYSSGPKRNGLSAGRRDQFERKFDTICAVDSRMRMICWFDKGNELLQIIWGSAFDRRQTPDRLYDLPGFSFTFSFRTLQRKTYLCSSLLPLCFSYIAQGGFWYRTFIYRMIEGSFIPVTGSMFRWQTAMGGGKTMSMMPVCLNRLYVSEVSEAGFLLPSIERYQLTFS